MSQVPSWGDEAQDTEDVRHCREVGAAQHLLDGGSPSQYLGCHQDQKAVKGEGRGSDLGYSVQQEVGYSSVECFRQTDEVNETDEQINDAEYSKYDTQAAKKTEAGK